LPRTRDRISRPTRKPDMYEFSERSLRAVLSCDSRLQDVAMFLISQMDVTALEGARSRERQEYLFWIGRSQTMNSRHLTVPSEALDIAPYPLAWPSVAVMNSKDGQAFARFAYMIGLARGYAEARGTPIRSGLDWDSDGEIADTSFFDLPHLELAT
jgi:hypothetical protein